MGLQPITTGSGTISTSPSNIDSIGYYYHHITIFITSSLGVSDQFTFDVYTYDSVSQSWYKEQSDPVDYTSTESGTIKSWQINPRPGMGVRVVLTKVAGSNATFNYEVVKTS